MRKTMTILAAVFAFVAVASAQPKALGGRIGNYGLDISYENFVGSGSDFLEFELGLDEVFSTNSFHFDGIYNIMIAHPDWSASGQWGFYAGPGASVAVWGRRTEVLDDNIVYAGILGNVGIEYIFDFPLQLSMSLRPRLMFGDGKVRDSGLLSLGLGVRYVF
ncbi:MAG: hypothetical protein IKR44_05415 [Bacteroidales bacterium]|nr:hypothetical protein [Bacteroidales bacterium]